MQILAIVSRHEKKLVMLFQTMEGDELVPTLAKVAHPFLTCAPEDVAWCPDALLVNQSNNMWSMMEKAVDEFCRHGLTRK